MRGCQVPDENGNRTFEMQIAQYHLIADLLSANEAVEKVSDHPATAEPAAQCEGDMDAQEATPSWPATRTST